MRHLSATILLFLSASGLCGAADIHVVALTAGKVVVQINGGRTQTLSVGQVSPEGVRLIEATSASATFEYGGTRRTLGMAQGISIGGGPVSAQRATLVADTGGHFVTTATVNGVAMRFMVDTGASLVTIGSREALRAGINYLAGRRVSLQTANGMTTAYRVRLDSVRLGDIALDNVDGVVVEGAVMGDLGLLGLSFLNRVDMRREGSTMTLTRRP